MKRTEGKRLAFLYDTKQLQEWLKMVAERMDTTAVCRNLPSGPQVGFISEKAGIILRQKLFML